MSNLPVPGIPSRQEVDDMKRMMQIMNGASNVPAKQVHQAHYSGGYQGTAPRQTVNESVAYGGSFAGREDVDAMKAVLERFKAVSGDEEKPRQTLQENVPAVAAYSRTPSAGTWTVKTYLDESNGKKTKTYDVTNGTQIFAESLVVQEAADAVAKYLNKGLAGDHAKIQEVLDLEETYNRNRLDASKIKARYNRCVDLGESEAAEVFRGRHQVARANAIAAQDQIKSILEAIR